MLSLTYHIEFPADYRVAKRQINSFCKCLRRRGIKNLWVVEFQERGVPHYHVWMDRRFENRPAWEDSEGKKSWRPLGRAWLRISGQGGDPKAVEFTLHEKSYKDWTVIVGKNYAAKYASKNLQKELPEGIKSYGRWWGCSRDLVLETENIRVVSDICDPWDRAESVEAWNVLRRQVKSFIERKYKFKFPRDKVGSLLSIRWTMCEEHVACINRMVKYYLRHVACVREPAGPLKERSGRRLLYKKESGRTLTLAA
jgi:hypothetical protein